MPDLLARYPQRKGIGAIRAIPRRRPRPDPGGARGALPGLHTVHDLPTPRFNAAVEGYECDCVWFSRRLIVELDGRATHDTRLAFEWDRERDRVLSAAGWRVIRITWRQLHQTPERVAADLRRLLVG